MCNENSIVKLQNGMLKLELDMHGFSEARKAKILSFIMNEYLSELTGVEVEEKKEEKSREELIKEAYIETYSLKDSVVKPTNKPVEEKQDMGSDMKKETATIIKNDSVSVDSIEEEAVKKLNENSYRKVGGGYTFQTYYMCPSCGMKKKAYIFRQPYVNCYNCGKRMSVKPALNDADFPHVDGWGNVYVAGLQRPQENNSDIEKVYQFKLEQEMTEATDNDKPDKLKVK